MFDSDLTQGILLVYDLKGNLIRLDNSRGSGYWKVTQDGLFQFGHSKDHRPDLPQFKVMLATLDPPGLAVSIQVPSGEKVDDPIQDDNLATGLIRLLSIALRALTLLEYIDRKSTRLNSSH